MESGRVGNAEVRFKTSQEFTPPLAGKVLDAEFLIRKAFEQDVDAGITLLFQHYYAVLCSHAIRYVSSRAIAEDIVSDVYYEFQSRQLYQTVTTSFRAYLFTTVRNRTFDYIRVEMRRSASLENARYSCLPSTAQPDSITQYEELYQDIQHAINAMPIKRRQIYLMHRFEGKKYQEIANELNLSLRTVEAHLYQAIRQIRIALKDKWLGVILLIGQVFRLF